jgi:hypothetical protein
MAAITGQIPAGNDALARLNYPLTQWQEAMVIRAKTVNDLLAESDTFWKAERKQLNAEKERMQKLTEGLTDMNTVDAEIAKLQSRQEIETNRRALTAEINNLTGLIAGARATAQADANRITNRARHAAVATTLGARKIELSDARANLSLAEAKRNALTQAVQKTLERVLAVKKEADAAEVQAGRLVTRARHATLAATVPVTKANQDTVKASLAALESARPALAQATQDAVALVFQAKKEAVEATAPLAQTMGELRTDDFQTNAVAGKHYFANVVMTLGSGLGFAIERVDSWREVIDVNPDADEAHRNRDYELAQLVIDAVETHEQVCAKLKKLDADIKVERNALDAVNAQVVRAEIAAEELAKFDAQFPPSVVPDEDEQRTHEMNRAQEESEAAEENDLARKDLLAVEGVIVGARKSVETANMLFVQAESSANEIVRLDGQTQSAPTTPEQIKEWETNCAIAKVGLAATDFSIETVTRLEQDRLRIDEAAKKRSEVEQAVKVIGKVIDMVAQKKQEIVSGSIEAPLAVANQLAAGILKGPLVFEEGEVGMRVGTDFVSARTFSGTETAIVMMGLTAGLASQSKLRVLMLDELGRLDSENAAQLIANLLMLVESKAIDQFFVFGPPNKTIVDTFGNGGSSNLNVIAV